MKYKIKGVLFDLDQTLCNTEDFLLPSQSKNLDRDQNKYAEYQVFKYLKPQLKIISWKKFKDVYYRSRKEIHDELKGTAASHNRYLYIQRTLENLNFRFNPALIYKANQIYWNFVIKNMRLYPHVKSVLKILKQNHIKNAILSDLTADIQIKKLKKLHIHKYIDYLITSEEANSDKPSMNQVNLALKKMSLNKNQVVIVGNNPKTDIELAKRADIISILFDYDSIFKGEKRNANFYTSNFLDILDIINIRFSSYSKDKLIVFDMIGTLTSDPHLVSSILRNLLPNKITKIKKYYELYKVSKITRNKFWEKLNIKDFSKYEKKVISKIVIKNDAIGVLKKLKKEFKLAILSNIPSEWGNAVIKKYNLNKYFDEIIFSGYHKTKKPNPKLYKILLDRFPRIDPSNIYFLDDELGDLRSGKNLLMQTIWLKREEQDTNFIPDYVITTIGEIIDVVLV